MRALSFGLINEQDVFIMKLHGSWIFSGYLRNIQDVRYKNIIAILQKNVDTCVTCVIS
jgi:hypothetical protein